MHPWQVKSKADLLKALDDYNVGDKVVLMIQRGSEKLELPVALEEQSSWDGLYALMCYNPLIYYVGRHVLFCTTNKKEKKKEIYLCSQGLM